MKWLAQVLSSVVYSALFVSLVYLIIVYPLVWFLSLPAWAMFVVFLFGIGIIEGITTFLLTWLMTPYIWIVKRNSVAMLVSIAAIVVGIGYLIYKLWSCLLPFGFIAIVVAVIYTICSIQLMFAVISGILSFKEDSY